MAIEEDRMTMTAEEFYTRRDKRTETVVAGNILRAASLCISIDACEASTFAGQLCFLMLANLNARWCSNIILSGPKETLLHAELMPLGAGGDGTLMSSAHETMRRADPFGSFTTTDLADTEITTANIENSGSVQLHVGAICSLQAYTVMGRGWIGEAGPHLQKSPLIGDERNPLGAALAASIGTCYAMRRSLQDERLFSNVKLSLWNLAEDEEAEDGPALSDAHLGRVLVIGTGAIGSGILFLLPLLRQRPSIIDLVDGDKVDFSNLNRVPLFFAADVGSFKVDVAQAYLKQFGNTVNAAQTWFKEWAAETQAYLPDYDLVIPAANEFGVRKAIMHNTPPLMISGSTGSQWDAYRQRHIPAKDDCLVCRFPEVEQAVKLECSTGSLSPQAATEGAPAETGALPFLSVAGAVMAVAELAKLGYEGYPRDGNYCALWFRSASLAFLNTNKEPKSGCSYCLEDGLLQRLRN